jgi:predicted unusual protein kinase regulating ubiquinone biosynthesis (AarF/ABC1/UbiB family)
MDDKKAAKRQNKSIDKIKSSVFSRSLSIAKLTLQTGASMARHGVATALKNSEDKEESWKNLLKSQASLISEELGQLKGSLMKAGQMLSMYGEHFLPPEANEFLRSLQSNSHPLSWQAIEPIVKKSLSPEQLSELEIETQAYASASMGQVHLAKVKSSGRTIALKIQYPDVDKAIDSDLRAIRTILNTLKFLPRDVDLDPLFSEVRDMLAQETNYSLEADLTEQFYTRLDEDSRFIVPKVLREFSGPKILATTYERGLRADDPLIQSLPQARRNRLAWNFLDLYFKELFEWGVVQTDPHAGNYRIRIDPQGRDQIVLLDFGATRVFEKNFLNSYHRILKGSLHNDREMFYQASKELHFVSESDSPELIQLFEEFCFETVEPFISADDPRNKLNQIDDEGNYDWKNTDLPQRLSKKIFQVIQKHEWRTPPREMVFLDRKTGGVFIFLSILRAKIRGRDLIIPYLEKVK